MELKTLSNLPLNLDRKLVTTVLTSIVTYVIVTVLRISLDENAKGLISLVVGSIVAYFVPPSLTVDDHNADVPGLEDARVPADDPDGATA